MAKKKANQVTYMYLKKLPPHTLEAILKVYKTHWGLQLKDLLGHRISYNNKKNPYELILDWLVTYGLMTDKIREELFPYLFGEEFIKND